MDKFTKINKAIENGKQKTNNKCDVLYDDSYIKLLKFEDWTIVEEKDMVVCIPFFIEENKFLIRQEYVPTYKLDSGKEYHLTVLSGTIEPDETPDETLYRELQEEAGIILKENYKIEFENSYYLSKGNKAKYHICILPIRNIDYYDTKPSGDGSKSESKSQCVKIESKFINSLVTSDVITELMIMKLKKYLNL